MTTPYLKARDLGYSDEEIAQHFSEKDPEFKAKFEKGLQLNYSPEEIFSKYHETTKAKQQQQTSPKEENLEFGDYADDFGKQTAQGFGIGALGTYGDILDLFGLQAKDIPQAEKEKYSRDFATLQKMERGEVPSYGEFMDLSDDEVAPRISRLASSKDVEGLGGQLGLVSEPKTAAGRYGKRIGKLAGSSAAFGSRALIAPIVAGAAGQTLEEAGAPPWVQAAAEIIAFLKYSSKTPRNVSSSSPEVEEVIQNLKKAGYSEQDITLAKNALEERKILKKYASLTPEAENTIQKGIKNSEELFKEQIKKGLPGYAEGGLPYLEKQASNVYQAMEELASTVKVTNKGPVKKAIEDSIAYLEKYPLLDEQKKFIEFLKDGLNKLDKADTAEFFTGFYRNLGKAGNWGDPKQKEHLLGLVKQGIKDTFAESGSQGAKFGKYFEKTNDVWKHWLDAKDLMQTIEKTMAVDGVNFKKLTSILNDPKNYELAKKVLGAEQLQNIRSISEGAQAIESLLKQIPKSDKSAISIKVLESVISLVKGDYKPLAAIVTLEGAKRLATSFLIDPNKQNLMKKLIVAAKNNSPQEAAIIAEKLIK